jgi:hypothetical protein
MNSTRTPVACSSCACQRDSSRSRSYRNTAVMPNRIVEGSDAASAAGAVAAEAIPITKLRRSIFSPRHRSVT